MVDSLIGNVVVANFSLFSLHRFTACGAYLGEIGDAAFRGELKPLQARATRARWFLQAA